MTIKDSADALSPSERRYSDRKKLVVDVRFNGGDATGIANTRDVGVGGLYITTKTALDVGTPIFMRMTIGGKEVALNGTVVYSDAGKGVGVRFQDLSEDAKSILKNELDLE
ncbi:MAG: PilZ domain-containing protein [Pyrinomonadaceae bacterium]